MFFLLLVELCCYENVDLSKDCRLTKPVVTVNWKDMADTRRRVKLYALNAERQWDDRGTGHVSSSYIDRLKGMSLLVRAESDGKWKKEMNGAATFQIRLVVKFCLWDPLGPKFIFKTEFFILSPWTLYPPPPTSDVVVLDNK